MAIEKTTFVATTSADRQTEVYNWLSANATDYFETITNDTEHLKIVCTFAGCENAKIEFGTKTINMCTITYENKTTQRAGYYNTANFSDVIMAKAIKTSCGIYLCNNYSFTSSFSYFGSILISKNNDNSTCVSIVGAGENHSGKVRNLVCPEKSKVYDVRDKVITADMTTFAPIPIVEGVYPENMFFTPFSSVRNAGVITDSDGNKYFYDGYCAIKE